MFFVFNTDPRVNDWPLMDSPFPTLIMVITYLYIVTYLGPKVMANRKPFKLNNILVWYNAGQVIFSLVMLWEVGPIAKIKNNNNHRDFQTSFLTRFEILLSIIILNRCIIKTHLNTKERKSERCVME